MSYRLNKPFTAEEKDNFIFKYNQDCFHEGYHCRIEETDKALFALEPNEIMVDGEPVIDPDYEEKEKQKEQERIKMLSCTKRDFALMLQELGVTYSQLKTLIASNEQAQLEWDLCERLYRFNPLLDVMAEQLGITPLQLDMIFKTANGENTVEELRDLR